MSVKNQNSVRQYVKDVAEIRAALENIIEFVDTLPAPDDNNELPTLHYGHVGDIAGIRAAVGEVACRVDLMFASNNY